MNFIQESEESKRAARAKKSDMDLPDDVPEGQDLQEDMPLIDDEGDDDEEEEDDGEESETGK